MSTFNGSVKELENILIDNFLRYKTHTCFFLSHCHSDHMNGLNQLFLNIDSDSNYHLYCSPITRIILLNKYKLDCKNIIKELSSGELITVPENNFAPSYQVTVTCIPAGHCPGSVMFLFETTGKKILYTGDFRISKNDFFKYKPFHCMKSNLLDKLYFDSTFLNETYWNFPLRSEVVDELLNLIKNWMSKSPDHNVLLETSAFIGYEFIFVEIARKLKYKVHVGDALHNIFWNVPEVGNFLTRHCISTRIHAFGIFDKKCTPCSYKKLLTIKLSAQWYKSSKGMPRPPIWKEVQNQKIVLCYPTHCSCSEIVDFLSYLKPKSLEPCTTAVGSTNEDMMAYIKQLICSWECQEKKGILELTKADFILEKNYKFNLKLPFCKTEDFDDVFEISSEKKKKLS